jgi:hypothetical protein
MSTSRSISPTAAAAWRSATSLSLLFVVHYYVPPDSRASLFIVCEELGDKPMTLSHNSWWTLRIALAAGVELHALHYSYELRESPDAVDDTAAPLRTERR